ncbi:hypothetical protein HMI55_005956 [Coelomomyces lativittatus]|nr:hypothetical protein HMI56_007080 [Coelomomyces lativittatus]KAJ1513039.1 hypothetical protein HMI55_005956 [Coelomomyces lativittatus]
MKSNSKGNKSKNNSAASIPLLEELANDSSNPPSPKLPSSPLKQRKGNSKVTTVTNVGNTSKNASSSKPISIQSIYDSYCSKTSNALKFMDLYSLYILYSGVLQFIYACIVGSFPFNSFLSGFGSSVACFVFSVSLRMQVNPENKAMFGQIQSKAIVHFMICHFILHVICVNYVG